MVVCADHCGHIPEFTICIITNRWISVTKIGKHVSKETFVEASKVVDKPLDVIN